MYVHSRGPMQSRRRRPRLTARSRLLVFPAASSRELEKSDRRSVAEVRCCLTDLPKLNLNSSTRWRAVAHSLTLSLLLARCVLAAAVAMVSSRRRQWWWWWWLWCCRTASRRRCCWFGGGGSYSDGSSGGGILTVVVMHYLVFGLCVCTNAPCASLPFASCVVFILFTCRAHKHEHLHPTTHPYTHHTQTHSHSVPCGTRASLISQRCFGCHHRCRRRATKKLRDYTEDADAEHEHELRTHAAGTNI